jgi:hypothetical protein
MSRRLLWQIWQLRGQVVPGMRVDDIHVNIVKGSSSSHCTEDARKLEAKVFLEKFNNTDIELDRAYGPYLSQTAFVVAYSDKLPLGMMRLCLPGRMIQRSLEDSSESPFNIHVSEALAAHGAVTANVIDVVTLAVDTTARGGGVALAMLPAMLRIARAASCSHMTAIMDTSVMQYAQSKGFMLHALGDVEPQPYMGSPSSLPIIADVDSLSRAARVLDGDRELT